MIFTVADKNEEAFLPEHHSESATWIAYLEEVVNQAFALFTWTHPGMKCYHAFADRS